MQRHCDRLVDHSQQYVKKRSANTRKNKSRYHFSNVSLFQMNLHYVVDPCDRSFDIVQIS